ncbi:Conserved secreted protein [Caenorhabditis elegans]|uniref:Conserved secreted protein n=1 Tax=Caenorhabditis elegans TaxID=6239 RepID=Q4W5S9_CAEEL|nr:Conserved secreted protein [Caenorhabditis elegans]CCD64723.2 Conserved secreted protein [Caenorhabditis elegans]|eukprot:NP_001022458.2 Uncharacterized protein CELE_Y49F6B.13 [Caenorhabditis elegans]
MRLPVLLLAFIGVSVADVPSSQDAEKIKAYEIGTQFFSELNNAILSGDPFRVVKFITHPNIDVIKFMRSLKGWAAEFRDGYFVNGNCNEVSLSVIFKVPGRDYPFLNGTFVLEHGVEKHPITDNWTLKSMTWLTGINISKNRSRHNFAPPNVMG